MSHSGLLVSMAEPIHTLAFFCYLAFTVTQSWSESPYRRACTTSNSSSVTLSLECPFGHVIHVQHWLTSLSHLGGISECFTNDSCNHIQDSDSNYLTTSCNGLQSCNETIRNIGTKECIMNASSRYFHVEYQCIPDNATISLCSYAMMTVNSTSLYLKTPAFPDGSDATNTMCTCQVQGQGLSATVLDLYFPDSLLPGIVASLFISNSTTELWRRTVLLMVNREVVEPGTQDLLNISFHDHGGREQGAWLRVSATSGLLSIECGNSSYANTTPQPSTVTGTETAAISPKTSNTITVDSMRVSSEVSATTQAWPSSAFVHPVSSAKSTEISTTLQTTPSLARETASATTCRCFCQDRQVVAPENNTATVAVLSVLCAALAVALVASNLYHLRGRLCRGRDPTYARTEAPVAEDTRPYTELRIYENRVVALADRNDT